MPCWQKSQFQNKKIDFGSKYPNFGVKIAQLEPHQLMFSTRKWCLIGSLIRGYQKFYSLPKIDFWPRKWPTLAPNCSNNDLFRPVLRLAKEQCEQARWLLLVEKTIRAIEMSPNFAFMENVMVCCGCVEDAHWLSAAGVMCRCVGDRGCDTSFRPPTSIGLAYPIIITTMITMAINDYHQNHHYYDSGCDIFFWPLTSIV